MLDLDQLLRNAVERGASDVHIKVGSPPFIRIDVRLEKRWKLGERGWWGIIAEVLNATASTEVVSRSCSERGPGWFSTK